MNLIDIDVVVVVVALVVLCALWRGDRVKTGFRFHGAELFLSYWRKRR